MLRNPVAPQNHATDSSTKTVGKEASSPSVVLVSNRGPIEHHTVDGELTARRGSGGVVTALDALAQRVKGTWVATALTEEDRAVAHRGRLVPADGRAMGIRLVALDPAVARRHYLRFSNPLLWFLHHDLADLLMERPAAARIARDWWEGYVPANRALAEAAIAEALTLNGQRGPAPVVAVHDYQLYLVPGLVRAALPHVPIQHFVHIPWPAPAVWQHLPQHMVRSICESLLACNVVGFQTASSAERFVETCVSILPGAISPRAGLVTWRGQATRIATYPISVDVGVLQRQRNDAACQQYRRRLTSNWPGKTIVRVDRVDPSKNHLRGFTAYDRLLRRRPDLHGRVRLLAFLVPSRTEIPEYQKYFEAVQAAIDTINADHGTETWRPIEAFFENNYLQALAGMTIADVLFVNPIADGMNLVAKESCVVNERDAVLVLSKTAGAYAELSPAAIGIPPHDVDATAAALEQALALATAERRRRANWLRQQVEQHDVHQWLQIQLDDLASMYERADRSGESVGALFDSLVTSPALWKDCGNGYTNLPGDEQ